MNIRTHQEIDPALCGTAVHLAEGESRVELTPEKSMTVDEQGLVHGGFVFGLADYAAMIAVNHPNVVLGAADVKFLKPVQTGETVVAEATVEPADGKKRRVGVVVKRGEETVFDGVFICFVLDRHVLG